LASLLLRKGSRPGWKLLLRAIGTVEVGSRSGETYGEKSVENVALENMEAVQT
jgi:hypothetical protein